MSAPWLEDLVWQDLKGFLADPGETLRRVREQLAGADDTGELEARHADLTKRLAAKQSEKDRYVKLYAQDHISEEELETHLLDLKNQIGNLRLLVEVTEADLSQKRESALAAKSTEAWLLTLRERVEEVEEDTEEAFEKRRALAKLLVERIDVGRDQESGRVRVRTTYRFGPPGEFPPDPADDRPGEEDNFAAGERNSLTEAVSGKKAPVFLLRELDGGASPPRALGVGETVAWAADLDQLEQPLDEGGPKLAPHSRYLDANDIDLERWAGRPRLAIAVRNAIAGWTHRRLAVVVTDEQGSLYKTKVRWSPPDESPPNADRRSWNEPGLA